MASATPPIIPAAPKRLPKSRHHQSTTTNPSRTAITVSPPTEDQQCPTTRGTIPSTAPHQDTVTVPRPLPNPDTIYGTSNINSLDDANSTLNPRNFHHYPQTVDTLVIVCCHSIFHPSTASSNFPLYNPFDPQNWHLAPFQAANPETGKPAEHETFLAHISAGLDALTTGAISANSILVFSGGVTKQALSSLSEARSYYNAALALGLAQGHVSGSIPAKSLYDTGRILLEENATDSYQNLLFSVLLFRRATGRYPREVRVITHAFKAKRFLELHAPAIGWPRNRIRVQGIDPVMSGEEYDDTLAGEARFGVAPWKGDPLGVGEVLSAKRRARGWDDEVSWGVGKGLEESVKRLLNGKASIDAPWCEHAVPEGPTETSTL